VARTPVFEMKAERPSDPGALADSGSSAMARLTDLGVILQPGMAEFILSKHGWPAARLRMPDDGISVADFWRKKN
jgi:hypothetical protein